MMPATKDWPRLLDEILADLRRVDHAAPPWLTVPGTGRRIVVDRLYPEVGIAVRFKDAGREYEFPDPLLVMLCGKAGATAIIVDPAAAPTAAQVGQLGAVVSRAARRLAQAPAAQQLKEELLPRIGRARIACQRLRAELEAEEERARLKETEGAALKPLATYRLSWWERMRQRVVVSRRRFVGSWELFRQDRLAVLGMALILVFGLMTVVYPLLRATAWSGTVYDPKIGFDFTVAPHPSPPSWLPQPNNPMHTPNFSHLLGTDTLGHDVLSMLLAGTRPAFSIGLTAALATALVSTALGAIAAYWGGIIDAACMQIADVFLLLPAPLFMVIFGVVFKGLGSVGYGLIYGLVAGLGGAAIVMRSYALSLRNKPFIQASQIAGGGTGHIILRHMVPHMLPLAALYMMISVVGAVVADGFISFFGFSRSYINWGSIIYSAFTNQDAVNSAVTWNVLVPASLALSLFAAAFYLVARGLHRIADPRLRDT
jgi:peptide/nickel transport system permease protein